MASSQFLGPTSRLALQEAAREMRAPYRCDEQRVAILDATLDLVASEGCDTLRLRDVAARARVSIGSVQHYFDTRENLLIEAFEDWQHRALQPFNALLQSSGDAGETLRKLIDYVANADPGPSTVVWLSFCVSATRLEDLQDRVRSLFETWHSGLRKSIIACSKQERWKASSAAELAKMIMSLHFGRAVISAIENERPKIESNAAVETTLTELIKLASALQQRS